MTSIDAIEAYLSEQFEGKLFVDINLLKIGNEYTVSKYYYTVLDGHCYLIEGKILHPTSDKMIIIKTDCKMVGTYDREKSYKRTSRSYTYAQFKKMHFL